MTRLALLLLVGCSTAASARPRLLEAGFTLAGYTSEEALALDGMSREELIREQQRLSLLRPSKTSGIVLTSIGGALTIGAASLIGWGVFQLGQVTSGGFFSGLGEALIIACGVVLAIPGVILLIVGIVKLIVAAVSANPAADKINELQQRIERPEQAPPPPPPLDPPQTMRLPAGLFQVASF